MLDFVSIKAASFKRGVVDIYPEFLVKKSKDLMIRGRAFYAIWDDEQNLWSRSESDVQRLIDKEIYKFSDGYFTEDRKSLKLLGNFSSRKWSEFQQYCKSLPDNYHELDEKVTFSNSKVKKEDYVSRRLPYSISNSEKCPAYEELISTLYDPEERQKLEWAIGAVISGDSKTIQKFMVLYGGPRTGKSTILNIIQLLFPGYFASFDSRALGSSNNSFALEAFRTNPLIAIQHDGDLSHIEDNTKLNSIVSHEIMVVNEKFKSTYSSRFNSFIFMGTNKPVRITDAKSGIIRRLIDISPSGRKIPHAHYDELNERIPFELGNIARHCLNVYKKTGPHYYDGYLPLSMMSATNDFYNFIEDNYDFWIYDNPDGITLNSAWLKYKDYCEDSNIQYPYTKKAFKEELKNYFRYFDERWKQDRNYYREFLSEKLDYKSLSDEKKDILNKKDHEWLSLDKVESLFDDIFCDCLAQYANDKDIPSTKWSKVRTRLKNIDTKKLHYMKPPLNLIIIDFDIKDQDGNKSRYLNIEAASKWPPTYAEFSKSGSGIHLHYYYDGDIAELQKLYDKDVEIKTFVGNSALRRKLTFCNDIPIATLSSGLPLKGEKKMLEKDQIKSERKLRELIKRSLRKEIHGHTKPEIDFIAHILESAYNSGLKYDVRDLRPSVQTFALNSTNQTEYCLKAVSKMIFQSDEEEIENIDHSSKELPLIFFDVEVFPNLLIVVWKKKGGNNVVKMINPSPSEIEELVKNRLIGFNNRRYDNHILYARMMGYTNEQLFRLSQRIIVDKDRNAFFLKAYNLSYTDIYDFLSSQNKMSLKKWEIKLDIHHQELGMPWNKPVPEELWNEVADYCINDVVATEAVWNENQADWLAREMLSLLSGLTVNDTTNQHTTKIIIGNDRNPQSQYVYTDLGKIFEGYRFDQAGIPLEDYIPGTKIVSRKSIYRGEDPGEGGYAFANPGMYYNVPVLDIASMHPHSAITLNIFGDKYTKTFKSVVDARIAIKHKDYEKAKELLKDILPSRESVNVLDELLSDPTKAKSLADALKTAINSVYGLTSAKFSNLLRDPRNKDNIVAKYGALFMINLKHEVEERGFRVVHIKTDSIKIADATNDIIEFVMEYGKKYGYSFEHESTYKRMCIVNDAVYIAQYEDSNLCKDRYGYIPDKNNSNSLKWTATGTQFQIPYVFKTLFSKEQLVFKDLCETKSVSTSLYLDMNEDKKDVSDAEYVKLIRIKSSKPDSSLSKKEIDILNSWSSISDDELNNIISEGHDYRFVGKIGEFCPIKSGHGGGILLREEEGGEFHAVTGTKKKNSNDIYRWLESETVKLLKLEKYIDKSYYDSLVEDAISSINQYGYFDQFVSDDSVPFDAPYDVII